VFPFYFADRFSGAVVHLTTNDCRKKTIILLQKNITICYKKDNYFVTKKTTILLPHAYDYICAAVPKLQTKMPTSGN
jgi:hypothetical protein